ncbi:MAG: hypothetical protein ACE5LU_21040 [Anaerolineae bacterium]
MEEELAGGLGRVGPEAIAVVLKGWGEAYFDGEILDINGSAGFRVRCLEGDVGAGDGWTGAAVRTSRVGGAADFLPRIIDPVLVRVGEEAVRDEQLIQVVYLPRSREWRSPTSSSFRTS